MGGRIRAEEGKGVMVELLEIIVAAETHRRKVMLRWEGADLNRGR